MKNSTSPDTYTKVVLTVIAIMLTAIASRPLLQPALTAHAQPSYQFTGWRGGFTLFNPNTGDVWEHRADGSLSHTKIVSPDQPTREFAPTVK